jgi:SAM-dependent methyltransferase
MLEHHKQTIDLYLAMEKQYGAEDIRSLTWGSRDMQEIRFKQLLRIFDLVGMVILDAGCGRGDLYTWLLRKGIGFKDYIGVDLCWHHIEYATKKFPGVQFFHYSISEWSLPEVDIIFASGLFGFDSPDWEAITKTMIDSMFEASRVGICFNMQSNRGLPPVMTPPWRKLDPMLWLGYAMTKSKKVCLLHDYLKADFTIGVFKEPCER